MSPSGMTNMFTISLLVSEKGKGDRWLVLQIGSLKNKNIQFKGVDSSTHLKGYTKNTRRLRWKHGGK